MEVGDTAVDGVSKDDLATPTPFDPLRGLPQLFRPRGFSSDFSEDGGDLGGGSSRRNSTSEGGMASAAVITTTGASSNQFAVPPDMRLPLSQATAAMMSATTATVTAAEVTTVQQEGRSAERARFVRTSTPEAEVEGEEAMEVEELSAEEKPALEERRAREEEQ